MKISKYNASGNDFIIFFHEKKKDRSILAKQLCDRHSGIGADGMIVIVPSEDYDFEWEFYNCDGSTPNMCGNGSRACAHYAYNHKLAPKSMMFLTKAGAISAIVEDDFVEVELTTVKMLAEPFHEENFLWQFYDTGVPHLVSLVDDVNKFSIKISQKMRNKYNANVNFASIEDDILHVRTYERGVENETLACGTGIAASFYVANSLKKIKESSTVLPASKEKLFLRIKDNKLFFKGKVKETFIAILNEGNE